MKLHEMKYGPNPKNNPMPEQLPVYDTRDGVSAIDWRKALEFFQGDQNALREWMKRAGSLVTYYSAPRGQLNMNDAFTKAKQDRKKYVMIREE